MNLGNYIDDTSKKIDERVSALKVNDLADNFKGLHIIVPTGGGDRLPVQIKGIGSIAEARQSTGVDIKLILANFAAKTEELVELRNASEAVGVPVEIVSVDGKYKTAGYSFNTGVDFVLSQQREKGSFDGYPIAKFDDDSVLTNGVVDKIMKSLRDGGYGVVSPLSVRRLTIEEMIKPGVMDRYKKDLDTSAEAARCYELYPDQVLRDGKFHFGQVMASWNFWGTEDLFVNTENMLTMKASVAQSFHQAGGVFIPDRITGEGYEFLVQAKNMGVKMGYISNAFIIDRPSNLLDQNFFYGFDDAILGLAFQRSFFGKPGLEIVGPMHDGTMVQIDLEKGLSLPNDSRPYFGTLVYPREFVNASRHVDSMGISPEQTVRHLEAMCNSYNARIGSQVVTPQFVSQGMGNLWKVMPFVEEIIRQTEIMALNTRDRSKRVTLNCNFGELEAVVSFPFKAKLDMNQPQPPKDRAHGSYYHTLGCMAVSSVDDHYLMTQL